VLCGYKLAGFKKSADFSENRRNLAGSARSKFKNHRFLEFKFRNIEKIGKLCKKTRSNSKNIGGEIFSNLNRFVG
jgi:hypothetical protein